MRISVDVDVELEQFDDDEIKDEALGRHLFQKSDLANEAKLLELMGILGLPDDLQGEVRDWLTKSVADAEALQRWLAWAGP